MPSPLYTIIQYVPSNPRQPLSQSRQPLSHPRQSLSQSRQPLSHPRQSLSSVSAVLLALSQLLSAPVSALSAPVSAPSAPVSAPSAPVSAPSAPVSAPSAPVSPLPPSLVRVGGGVHGGRLIAGPSGHCHTTSSSCPPRLPPRLPPPPSNVNMCRTALSRPVTEVARPEPSRESSTEHGKGTALCMR